MSFDNLNLHPSILKALHQCGYNQPTPIQEQSIPRVMAGKDLIAIAQTGTGKTAAFTLPALHQLIKTPRQSLPSILILAPVRELATQITDAIYKYRGQNHVKVVNILGGMPYHAQMRQLRQGADIIVATPGRLIDYLQRGQIIDLSQIKMLILDEADRMLDMGFIEDIKLVATFLPQQKQTLLFTATMDEPVMRLAQKILKHPEQVIIPGKSVTLENIKQSIYIADDAQHKNNLLIHLLTNENIFKAIIFSGTKRYAEKLTHTLRDAGYEVDVLHGDIKQHKRNRILQQFHQGKIQFLVATDVAARGIDVRDITHVINYDLPRTGEDYVHRIGRTGRAGKTGIAISFVLTNEITQLKRVERFIKSNLSQQTIEGLEPKKPQRPAEIKHKRMGGHKPRYSQPYKQPHDQKSDHKKHYSKNPADKRQGDKKYAHKRPDHKKTRPWKFAQKPKATAHRGQE